MRLWTGTLVLLCLGTLLLLFRHIERTLPYPHHADEGFISGPASNVLVKGELHPRRFNYPSLPTYLAAGAMAVGFLRGATRLEIRDVSQIGKVGYPYYETPRIMQTARRTFALLSVVCLAATGLSAWLAFRRPSVILLAPLILLASPLYFRQSWVYLNVDIVATSFAMLTIAAVLAAMRAPSIARAAIVPGLLAGLATASKYTLAITLLPVLGAIVLYMAPGRRIVASLAAVGAMFGAFLAAVPYSVLDIPGFLNGLGYEAFHYASGHAGNAADPGWPQLVYYSRHFVTEAGPAAALLAVAGLLRFPWIDWRRAAVIIVFPLGLLWLLTSQRVHFTRNALAIQPFLAMFAAYGTLVLHDWIVASARRRGLTLRRISVPVLATVVLVTAAVPFWRLAEHLRDRTDSRNRARAWVSRELPSNWAVVLPAELGVDHRGFAVRGRQVKVVELRGARDAGALAALLQDVPSPAVMLIPRWGADQRSPGQRTANELNAVTRHLRVVASFGSNDVLVNYLYPTAWGDPAFSIAVIK